MAKQDGLDDPSARSRPNPSWKGSPVAWGSLWSDIKIILKTVPKMFKGSRG
jgi:hypothetical protein